MVNDTEKYIVRITTAKGPVDIASPEQWNLFEFVGAYIAISRRNQISGTNKVPVSAFFTNTPEDARNRVLRRDSAPSV